MRLQKQKSQIHLQNLHLSSLFAPPDAFLALAMAVFGVKVALATGES